MVSEDNTLEIGQSRLGLMIDGLPETPRVAAKLERDEQGVELTIPFLEGHDDIYSYWFTQGVRYGDDPDRTKRRYEPPDSVSFYDAAGKVALIGSRVAGSTHVMGGTNVGEGRLRFDYTVLGGISGPAYQQINGLRSEIEGLGTWVGLRSLEAEQTREAGRLTAVNFKLESPPTIRVARRLNTDFRANWRYGPGPSPDETTISERLQIHTEVRRAVDWDQHLETHFAIRDLLRVAAWRQLNFVSHEAMSTQDGIRTMDGVKHGDLWFPVITQSTGIRIEAPTKFTQRDYLFAFSDVQAKGVGRWIDLVQKFERGLSPLIGLLDLEGATLEAHLAQIGIGFEMLGYDLLIESGISKTQVTKKSYADLASVVSSAVADVLPFPAANFPDLLRRTYVGVKHADNAPPDINETYLAYLQAIQVVRAWVGRRLGVSTARLKRALAEDARSNQIQEIASRLKP